VSSETLFREKAAGAHWMEDRRGHPVPLVQQGGMVDPGAESRLQTDYFDLGLPGFF
jgi:hypothetical protein